MQISNLRKPQLAQHSYYLLISVVALGIDQVISNIFFYWTGLLPVVASSIGYLVGLVAHYQLGMWLVFGDSRESQRFLNYFFSGLVGLAIHYSTTFLCTQALGFPFFISKVLAALISFLIVYRIRVMIYGLKNEQN